MCACARARACVCLSGAASRYMEAGQFDSFDLRVIFERNRTGFEESKDFPIEINGTQVRPPSRVSGNPDFRRCGCPWEPRARPNPRPAGAALRAVTRRWAGRQVIAGQYQVIEYLGSAAFSKAVQCIDLRDGSHVCIKIIK